jgi:1-acyl-sn-glycerol-3-phosphate acyltransferase
MIREWIGSAITSPEIEAALEQVDTGGDDYDPWGFGKRESRRFFSLAHWIYKYFRPEIHGIENVGSGRVLIVANHSGQLPFDGLVIAVACLLKAKPPRIVRAMAERWVPTLPFINVAFSRSGVVLGDPINCKNLLEAENAILVFPEGAKGSGKTWDHAYRLVEFGRGFMRLALQTNTPIVPVAVVGGEESIISVHNAKSIAKLFGTPYFPVPALLPVLGPLAYLPLPTRFVVHFGERMSFSGPFDDEDEAIDRKVQEVKDRIQSMIDQGLSERGSIF